MLSSAWLALIGLALPALSADIQDPFNPDPSKQEIALFDWSTGAQFTLCPGEHICNRTVCTESDLDVQNASVRFRTELAKLLGNYCIFLVNQNREVTCLINNTNSVAFTQEHVVFLDGFPRREFRVFTFRFMVTLPLNAMMSMHRAMPLLSRQVLCAFFKDEGHKLAANLQWNLTSFDKYPRYDDRTEFMNLAIIPIVVITIPLMVFLAYWTSSLRPNMSSESWMVMGASGGKNYAYRRTLEIIAEQNLEYERQKKMALTRHILVTPPRDAVGAGTGMLLDVARLSIKSAASAQFPPYGGTLRSGAQSASQPAIVVQPSSDTASLASTQLDSARYSASTSRLVDVPEDEELDIEAGPSVSVPTVDEAVQYQQPPVHPYYAQQHHLIVKAPARGHHRRQSSIDEIGQKRRARVVSSGGSGGGGGSRQWKTGSLMLFGSKRK